MVGTYRLVLKLLLVAIAKLQVLKSLLPKVGDENTCVFILDVLNVNMR